MKRLIASILAILYLSTSVGATVSVHYCMGKLTDWGLGHKESKTCDNCGMEEGPKKDGNCCRSELKLIKNSTDQKLLETSFQLVEVMGSAIAPAHAQLPSAQIVSVTEKNPVSNAPPRSSGLAIYILDRIFLI